MNINNSNISINLSFNSINLNVNSNIENKINITDKEEAEYKCKICEEDITKEEEKKINVKSVEFIFVVNPYI